MYDAIWKGKVKKDAGGAAAAPATDAQPSKKEKKKASAEVMAAAALAPVKAPPVKVVSYGIMMAFVCCLALPFHLQVTNTTLVF